MSMLIDVTAIDGSDAALVSALAAADLPTADLEDPGRQFFRVEQDGELIGYGGLEVCGPDALLRSVAVPEPLRGRGLGRQVVDAMLREAQRQGVTHAYLFTTSAVGFFEHLGFATIDSAVEAVKLGAAIRRVCP